MGRVRCPFCHEYIDRAAYPAHEARHLEARPDGQQTDYATLPEDEREPGDLAGVPRVYVHRKCGGHTEMPEDVIRSYLQDPYLYSADETFCTGCGRHVPFRECTWTETGENLQAYMDDLRAAKPRMRPRGGRGAAPPAGGRFGAGGRRARRPARRTDWVEDGQPVRTDPACLPDVGLRVGDGDGFVAVLEDRPDRLVIGTAPGWDRAMLAWLAVAALAVVGAFVTTVVRAFAMGPAGPGAACGSTPCLAVSLALGLYMVRSLRSRYVIDARAGEVVRTTHFGLARRRVPARQVAEVAAGEVYIAERTARGLKLTDEPHLLNAIFYDRRGRTLLEVEGLPARTPEAAFYLLVAARAAAVLGVPLGLYQPPDEPARSVRGLWAALADADPAGVDWWADQYGRTLRRTRPFGPVCVYAVLGLTGVLAAAAGLRWQSPTLALTLFPGLLAAATLVLAGAALLASVWQPGVRPSAYSLATRLAPLNRWGVAPVVGGTLVALGGLVMFGLTTWSVIAPPMVVVDARERARRAEGDGPRLTYRIETRPDGTKDVVLDVRNMKPVDVGLHLLGCPEPEAREKGVRELDAHVDRRHPRRADVVAGLTPYLHSEKDELRRIAAQALGHWGFPETVAALEPLLGDPDPRVRSAAQNAIREIGTRQQRGEG